jgi:alkylation response protein AidB-like acyl-CoA dehydrogenase
MLHSQSDICTGISVWVSDIVRCSQMWISNAKEAGVFVVFATIDPALGYKGITAFVIDKVRLSSLTISVPLVLNTFNLNVDQHAVFKSEFCI